MSAFGKSLGVTASGEKFELPETFNSVEILSHWRSLSRPATFLSMFLFVASSVPFLFFDIFPKWFSLVHFVIWRLAYNLGLGMLLHNQSHYKSFQNWYEKVIKNPTVRNIAEQAVVFRDPSIPKYNVDDYPAEYNAWMMYRLLTNIVLGNDVVTHAVFCILYRDLPSTTTLFDILLYIVGVLLCLFALWSKVDAHRVLGEYAWYWGDFFFLLDVDELNFDGIFQMFPHPMYTVGYCFYYGLALITHSYTVLFVSILAHCSQMMFLCFVEDPHIQRTYCDSIAPQEEEATKVDAAFKQRKDLILFFNMEIYRSSDLLSMVIFVYIFILACLGLSPTLHLWHAFMWRVLYALVFVSLYLQSTNKAWTNAYEKNGWTRLDAFEGFKKVYNLTMMCNHLTALNLCLHMFVPGVWGPARITEIVAGLGLIGLNIWASWGTYDVVGDFGFFYGDFFVEDIPKSLHYHGIYRYMNNPETVLGCAGYYGLALIANSWGLGFCALLHHLMILGCARFVEKPHMEKKYGATVRPAGGIQLGVKKGLEEGKAALKKLKELPKALPHEAQVKLNKSFDSIQSLLKPVISPSKGASDSPKTAEDKKED